MQLLKKVSAVRKNIHFQSLLGNGVMAVLGMLTIAILYRGLSVKDIGIYIFFLTILNLVDTLRSGFLTTAFIKFYSGTNEQRAREVSGSAWVLGLVITSITVIINIPAYFLSFYVSNEGLAVFLKLFSVVSLVSLPNFLASLMVQGNKRFDRLLWLRLINQGLFFLIALVLFMLKIAQLKYIIIAYVLCSATGSIFALLAGWTMIGTIKNFSKKTVTELYRFGRYSVGTNLSANLFSVTDTFFINFFLGPAALAVFNLGGKLLQIIEIPLVSFAASNMPGLSGYYNNGDKEKMMYVMKKMVGMLSVVIFGVMILSIIFAEPIIVLIGGEKYLQTEAPNLFRIFMTLAILYPADRFFALTVDIINKPKINLYKILAMLAVNLVGDYVGLAIYKSVYSIAIVNIIPIMVSITITFITLNKHVKFSFWNIYIIGYKEIVLLIKGTYTRFFKVQTS
jgi:O-antigen/teichoic acid export membrane protein